MLVNEVALGNIKVRGCPHGGLEGVGTTIASHTLSSEWKML